jgi:hypothetical protein
LTLQYHWTWHQLSCWTSLDHKLKCFGCLIQEWDHAWEVDDFSCACPIF